MLRANVTVVTVRESFAERLRQALNEGGYRQSSQRDLSLLFGVTPQAVRKWMMGDSMPSSTRAPQVAKVLGVRKAWLFDAEPPMRATVAALEQSPRYHPQDSEEFSISHEEVRLLTYFRALPRKQQLTVKGLLISMQQKNAGTES
jgi:transcriptional regulator with XRE-family HTH domain